MTANDLLEIESFLEKFRPFSPGEPVDFTSPEYTARVEDNVEFGLRATSIIKALVEEVRNSWMEIYESKMYYPEEVPVGGKVDGDHDD